MYVIEEIRNRTLRGLGKTLLNRPSKTASDVLERLLLLLSSFSFYGITDKRKLLSVWNELREDRYLTETILDVTGHMLEAVTDVSYAFSTANGPEGKSFGWDRFTAHLGDSLITVRNYSRNSVIWPKVKDDAVTSTTWIVEVLLDNPWLVTLLLLYRSSFEEIKQALKSETARK